MKLQADVESTPDGKIRVNGFCFPKILSKTSETDSHEI